MVANCCHLAPHKILSAQESGQSLCLSNCLTEKAELITEVNYKRTLHADMYIIFTNLLMSVLMTPPPPPPADCHCPGPELVTILVIGSQNNNAFSHSKCTQLSFLYCLFKRRVLECAMFRITIIQLWAPHSSSSLMSPRYAHLTSCITS